MISVLFIGSLYWSQPPINRETGIQQCTSEDLKTKVMWSWVSNTGTSGLSESVKPTFLGSEVCNELYYWATRSRKTCLERISNSHCKSRGLNVLFGRMRPLAQFLFDSCLWHFFSRLISRVITMAGFKEIDHLQWRFSRLSKENLIRGKY